MKTSFSIRLTALAFTAIFSQPGLALDATPTSPAAASTQPPPTQGTATTATSSATTEALGTPTASSSSTASSSPTGSPAQAATTTPSTPAAPDSTFCSVKPSVPADFVKAQERLQKRLTEFANSKEIASLADQTLGGLVSAKSPVIANWMKARNLQQESEEKIIRTWREYYAKYFILSSYPHKDAKVSKAIAALVDNVNRDSFPKSFKPKMQKHFTQARELARKRLEAMNLPEKTKKAILARVSAIKLYWLGPFTKSKLQSNPLEFLDWGIAYDPATNEINMGINALAHSDEQTILAVFAHEIGHAFDSCRWGAYFEGPWPFESVGECLRSEKSVAARRRDDSQMAEAQKAGRITEELVTALKANPTCNKVLYPPPGVQADQLPETFADWFSAEALTGIEKLNLSVRSDLCEARQLNVGSAYLPNTERLFKIYFANPIVRQKLQIKAEATAVYCAL